MKITTLLKHLFISSLVSLFTCIAGAAPVAAPAGNVSHLGPTIKVMVQRGSDRLPIYWVNHLQKGDRLVVTTDQAVKTEKKWLAVLATITPISNQVVTRPFELTAKEREASIEITADDQIPVIVLAPQVRTLFGIYTSFSESADLISDAIKTDPQRFIDLQKIDQINHAINYLLHVLDALIQNKKTDQAIDAAKDLAAKFGVKYIDPDCFKGSTVNTRCVATNIVSSAELNVPSDDIWSAAGPNADSVKLPTDIFAGLKLITETSTYLVNKYGDNYDFAPSLGQRSGDSIQLFTNARFKSGDIKTAYIYVPSWFDKNAPEISVDKKSPPCLTRNELNVAVKGTLPLLNYWHDWKLVLHAHGSGDIVAQYSSVDFKPDAGLFVLSDASAWSDIPFNGQLLDATLSGKFGFADVTVKPFTVIMPAGQIVAGQIGGLDSLISGEQVKLSVKDKSSSACIEQLNLQLNLQTGGTTLPGESASAELSADLSKTAPGPANLEIVQYGVPRQTLPVTIYQRRAHLQKISHNDLETALNVTGDNLDRIDFIELNNKLACRDEAATSSDATPGTRIFSCPAEAALNAAFPARVTVRHKDGEPAAVEFAVTKIAARPHMLSDGASSVVTKLSATALQWNLNPADQYISEDSGLSLLLHAFGGYKLSRGNYQLQLKFTDDPQSDAAPLSVALMSDLAHNELRTKKPVTFDTTALPGVVNPIWYRVVHQPSGLTGDWQPLNRSVIYLPQLTTLSCTPTATLIHGSQLELIDWATGTDSTIAADGAPRSVLAQCGHDQCLELSAPVGTNKLHIKLHWIDNRVFDVTFADVPPACAVQLSTATP